MYTCKCEYCGNSFEASFKDVKICEACKNRPCEVCGKPFKHDWPYDQNCCSKECRIIWRKDPKRVAEREAKKRATLQAKYGVVNVSQLADVKVKISESRSNGIEYYSKKAEAEREQRAARPKLIRKCILCGKEFEAIGSQSTCSGPHYKKCVVCGKDFIYKHISDKKETCSSKCTAQLRKTTISSVLKKCQYCGKEFFSVAGSAKYCPGPHYKKCVICGREFKFNPSSDTNETTAVKTCSTECREKLREQSCLEKYGVPFAVQTDEARERARQTSIENTSKRKQTNLEKYGFENYTQTEEGRKRLSERTSSKEVQNKIRKTNLERYGVEHTMQSPEFARKHSNSQFGRIVSDGTRVDSSWEALVYEFFLRNNIDFEYNTVSFPIEYNGMIHMTHIDFKVGDMLFEIKGSHLLEGAYDKYDKVIPISKKIDVYKKNHVIVITDSSCASLFGRPNSNESNGLKYLDKCPEPLIGVDISLFNYPEFPFAEDRPPCFYNVKVDGERSSVEAFNDEKIIWKMILNRINYSGGFIDAKQILNAMNITRTCKQPSWFSKSLARRIIDQYCTSGTICDPFAGWGMRYDAAIEAHKQYVGADLNAELVDWHNEHGRSIQLGDATEFKFDQDCSVFICPPYSDPKTGRCFEDYNFDGFDSSAEALSQCDWLKVVMKNVPNAREYVMVCKIVDEGWEGYVAETLSNRSHFGTNNEYVIVVKQEQKSEILKKNNS